MMSKKHRIICRLPSESGSVPAWGIFISPIDIVVANCADDIICALNKVEKYTESGKYAAGFVSYEAAPAFDEAFKVNESGSDDLFPLLYFGIYDAPSEIIYDFSAVDAVEDVKLIPDISFDDYISRVKRIKEYIYEGDIYQANFTFRSKAAKIANSYNLFCDLMYSHPVPYGAYIDTGEFQILSLSPELFLEKQGDELLSIPMKGTAARKSTTDEDLKAVANLAKDPKNRAENLMIVDMVRNDLGRICRTGSIKADPLFHVDTYSTLHQMISEVRGTVDEHLSLTDIFTALFPAASITGAPKVRSMQIIQELESSPRKLYTGSIGCITPDMNFVFNVAIRTLICNENGVELGIGSGIVADSVPEDEWSESLLKSSFITAH